MDNLIAYIEENQPEIEKKIDEYNKTKYNFNKGENEGRLALLRILKGKTTEKQMDMEIILEFLDRINKTSQYFIEEQGAAFGDLLDENGNEEDLEKIFGIRYAFNCGLLKESEEVLRLMGTC